MRTSEYPDQIVVMADVALGAEVRAQAEMWGVSIADVMRIAAGYGLPKISSHYSTAGRKPLMSREEARRRVTERQGRAVPSAGVATVEGTKSRKPRKRDIPAAVFASPSPAR